MTAQEFQPIAARMVKRWPNVDWAQYTTSGYFHQLTDDLSDLDADQVSAAVDVLAREGNRFPPTGGEIRKTVVALTVDAPDWAEVQLTLRKVAAYPESRWVNGERVNPRAERLSHCHPLLVAFVERIGWREAVWANSEDRTAEAQVRNKWMQLVHRAERDEALRGLPTAGLRALERVNSGPSRIGAAVTELIEEAK